MMHLLAKRAGTIMAIALLSTTLIIAWLMFAQAP